MKQQIPKADLIDLIKRVASGDNSRNVELKERYELAENQRTLLNNLFRLARTGIFQQVQITKLR